MRPLVISLLLASAAISPGAQVFGSDNSPKTEDCRSHLSRLPRRFGLKVLFVGVTAIGLGAGIYLAGGPHPWEPDAAVTKILEKDPETFTTQAETEEAIQAVARSYVRFLPHAEKPGRWGSGPYRGWKWSERGEDHFGDALAFLMLEGLPIWTYAKDTGSLVLSMDSSAGADYFFQYLKTGTLSKDLDKSEKQGFLSLEKAYAINSDFRDVMAHAREIDALLRQSLEEKAKEFGVTVPTREEVGRKDKNGKTPQQMWLDLAKQRGLLDLTDSQKADLMGHAMKELVKAGYLVPEKLVRKEGAGDYYTVSHYVGFPSLDKMSIPPRQVSRRTRLQQLLKGLSGQ